MRLLIRLFILGMLLSIGWISVSAQVQPRWHLRVTEPDPSDIFGLNTSGHSLEAMALDGDGNVYLAGQAGNRSPQAYVAKCSGIGQLLWEKHWDGMLVDSLVVTATGNSFVSFHTIVDDVHTASLVKLDPAGNEVWRADPESDALGEGHVTSLVQNSRGELFWLAILAVSEPAGDGGEPVYRFPWIVSKFSEDGHRLWRTELPSGHLEDDGGGLRDSMAAGPDGGVVVASFRCTRLNADGTLRWTVLPPEKAVGTASIFSTAALGVSDAVLAGGEFISPDGTAALAGWRGVRNRVVGYIPGQGFLTSVGSGVWCFDDQGAERWHIWLGNSDALWPDTDQSPAFAISPSGDGWFAFAMIYDFSPSLIIWRFENDGRLRWRKKVSDLDSNRLRLSVAPDGTLVAAGGMYDSFQYSTLPTEVFSFAVEEDPAAPRVTSSPAAADWDGVTPLNLSVEAVGEALTYQWRRVWQTCAGETNSTILLKPLLGEFTEPGSYWCEVSNTHGMAASRMASVTFARPRMALGLTNDYFTDLPQLNPSPILGFESAKEIDRPFEVSTNLVDWTIGPTVTNWLKRYDGHFLSGVEIPVSGSGPEFYRLRPTGTPAGSRPGISVPTQ